MKHIKPELNQHIMHQSKKNEKTKQKHAEPKLFFRKQIAKNKHTVQKTFNNIDNKERSKAFFTEGALRLMACGYKNKQTKKPTQMLSI